MVRPKRRGTLRPLRSGPEGRCTMTSNQQALEQQLLEAIDRLHPGTDCDNLRLRDAIVCLINASRRPADETSACTCPEVCKVCGGRAKACAILGHRSEADRSIKWHECNA